MSSGKGTTILQAVAYPPHMFYAPLEVWIANLVTCLFLASVFEQPLIYIVLGPVIHIFAVRWYRRDPHIVAVCISTFKAWRRRARSRFGPKGWLYEA